MKYCYVVVIVVDEKQCEIDDYIFLLYEKRLHRK